MNAVGPQLLESRFGARNKRRDAENIRYGEQAAERGAEAPALPSGIFGQERRGAAVSATSRAQSRGAMPFSRAYAAADLSIIGRTSA